MSAWSRAWDRTREPLPCQYEGGVCIRCNQPQGSGCMWRCEVPFYGLGDFVFRITKFLDLRTCDPCHSRRTWLNLTWHRFCGWLYTAHNKADH